MRANITANGVTAPMIWSGGRGSVIVWGDFGGGTAKLQMSPDGATWIDIDHPGDSFVIFTASGCGGFELTPCQIRVTLAGATNPSVAFKVSYLA